MSIFSGTAKQSLSGKYALDHNLSDPLPFWAPPLFYLLLSALFLWKSLFTGQVLLPAGLLGTMAPYSGHMAGQSIPPWNPLRWDGIAQFYPWRHFAAMSIRHGTIPLWNPYQFCGTPFIANSQSAVFYPFSIIFLIFSVKHAFANSVLVHLTMCGWFTCLLSRAFKASTCASLLAGVIFTWSAWQVNWLELPTFLTTSCWIPLLLRQVWLLPKTESRASTAVLGSFALGMMLLAGHLQIAFYGLLASSLLAIAMLVYNRFQLKLIAVYMLMALAGFAVSMPQLLPALELSHMSHREGKPTLAGYGMYTAYALQPQELLGLTLPNFFGNDYNPDTPYWGFYTLKLGGETVAVRHNANETALYVGILPLMLAGIALKRRVRLRRNYSTLFFSLLALLSLLLALGTPVDALFYFLIPGFAQSGSPARVLVLWALTVAVLSAFGLDSLLQKPVTKRELMGAALGIVFAVAIGLTLSAKALSTQLPGFNSLHVPLLGSALGRITGDWIFLAVFFVAGMVVMALSARNDELLAQKFCLMTKLAVVALVVCDLFRVGMPVNPTASPAAVYPISASIKFLQQHTGHQRIWPVNSVWGLDTAPPAVMPPNGATVFGLRDVQGYDSLFTGQYKQFADGFARVNAQGIKDASPPAVGNMIFMQNPNSPDAPDTSARYVITLPASSPYAGIVSMPPSGSPITGTNMLVYNLPSSKLRCRFKPDGSSQTLKPEFMHDGSDEVAVRVDAPTDGLLCLQDEYYPGWKAKVDGHFMPVLRHDGIFRAVRLKAGRHIVVFQYLPASFRFGLYLALITLCTAVSVLVINLKSTYGAEQAQ